MKIILELQITHSARHKSIAILIISHLIKFDHHSYHLLLIIASSFSVKILHRQDISFIRLLISFMMILSYSFNMTCFSSANVLHCRLLTRCLSIFHAIFDEFKSDDWEEWYNVSIQLAALKRTTTLFFDRVSWLLSLSSCKMSLLSWKIRASWINSTYTNNSRFV
jgi:hypothetical protein